MKLDVHNFAEFWPYYVRAHSKKATRLWHYCGTVAALSCLPAALATGNPWLLALGPVLGYGPAWYSHLWIEGNRPASWGHPFMSFASDFVMLGKMLAGTMDAEVERVLASGLADPLALAARAPHGA